MPDNSILVLMTCDPDVVRQRMVDDPHPYELVKSHEIEEIMEEFLYEYNSSYFRQKVEFDTTQPDPRRHTRTVPGCRTSPKSTPAT